MSDTRISVIIPCKNEEQNVQSCVESIRKIADEIIVADSGSTDQTMNIAACLGCRVIERELINFGNFKNWAISKASHAWVFVIDADERMTPELASEVLRTVRSPASETGYWVKRQNHFMGHPVQFGGWGRDRVIRLFRRDSGQYNEYNDHTEVQLSKNELGTLRNRLIHFTCWDYAQFFSKMQRYTDTQAQMWIDAGKRPSRFKLITNGPLRFFRDYVVHGGFLDGIVGFQVAAMTGFYSYLKQAKFWHKYHLVDRQELISSKPDRVAA